MPSWNEKPFTVPTINVNLKPCSPACLVPSWARPGTPPHATGCPGTPVLIPCPIPRTVEMTVRLAECTCGERHGWIGPGHFDDCPARPIRITCSIGGETWEGSEVVSCEASIPGDHYPARMMDPCRERWTLVKALVLGQRASDYTGWCGPSLRSFAALFAQRDAVFAALADMAQYETKHAARKAELPEGIRPVRPDVAPESHEALWRYVQRLVEQVGVLP